MYTEYSLSSTVYNDLINQLMTSYSNCQYYICINSTPFIHMIKLILHVRLEFEFHFVCRPTCGLHLVNSPEQI